MACWWRNDRRHREAAGRGDAARGGWLLLALAVAVGPSACSLLLDPPPLADGSADAGDDNLPDDAGPAEDADVPDADGVDLPPEDAGETDDAPGVCGDGTLNPGEECDSAAPEACPTSCGSAGSRSCGSDCRWSTCAPPAEVCNGVDDDCDTLVDDVEPTGFRCGDGCCNGDETAARCADDCRCTEPPAPAWPPNGWASGSLHAPASFETLRPTFRWRAPSAAGCPTASYDLQVTAECTSPGFATCPFAAVAHAVAGHPETQHRFATSFEVSATAPVGRRYYWRVRACRGTACSAWSAVRYLDVGRVPNDLDGNGYSDVVVGAPGFQSDRGRAHVYLGGPGTALDGGAADLEWRAGSSIPLGPGHQFGFAAAGAGDCDADGFADFVVGAPFVEGGLFCCYHGGAGTIPDCSVSFSIPTPGEEFAAALAGAGDLDADGLADLLIGMPGKSDGAGGLRVYLGRAGGMIYLQRGAVNGASGSGGRLGAAVAGLGDIDGDGFGDYAVGAPLADVGPAVDAGTVQVFSGRADIPTAPTPLLTLQGGAAGDRFGTAVAGLGDVNGDDYADFAVGAPGACPTSDCRGTVHVHFGGPRASLDGVADVVLEGPSPRSRFGSALAGGDVTRDGFADLRVGAPFDSDATEQGSAFFYVGSATFDAGAAPAAVGGVAGDRLGTTVAWLGDVTGDGYADMAAGAPGAPTAGAAGYVTVQNGAATGLLWTPYSTTVRGDTTETDRLGASIAAPPPP